MSTARIPGEDDSVGVITMTRARVSSLCRTMESVQSQRTTVPLDHLIVIDGCAETRKWFDGSDPPPNTRYLWVDRAPEEENDSGPVRCGKLRNRGVEALGTRWITFLDDDNLWHEDHVAELIACARRTGSPAVHSERLLFHRDGRPYLEPCYPWVEDEWRGRQIHAELIRKGVFEANSHRMRDRVDTPPDGTPIELMIDPAADPVMFVDPNEWLLSRDLLLRVPFREDIAAQDPLTGFAEDGRFLLDLVQHGIPVASSEQATLHYFLGGFSNTLHL